MWTIEAMNQLKITLISAALLFGLVAWGERPGHKVPTWLYLLAAAPLAWFRIFGTAREEEAEAGKGPGLLYLFAASIFLMIIGTIGRAMRGTWGEILAPALPFGAVVFVLTLVFIWLRPRS